MFIANYSCPKFYAFESDDLFLVPQNVTRVRVLLIGGGQGGQRGEYSGGDSGYVIIEEIFVVPYQVIPITVGQGGTNGAENAPVDGTSSSFGSYFSAVGSGGSGGGQGCDGLNGFRCTSGGGGSDGSNGYPRSGGGTWGSAIR